jgi:hypothetical protein
MTEARVEADAEKEAIKTEFKKQVFIPGLRNPGSALFLESQIRFRIRLKSRIRICIKVKVLEL